MLYRFIAPTLSSFDEFSVLAIKNGRSVSTNLETIDMHPRTDKISDMFPRTTVITSTDDRDKFIFCETHTGGLNDEL